MLGPLVAVLALMQAPAGQLGFDAPAGYVARPTGDVIVLAPSTPSDRAPCIYGVAPDRPASGDLEADAESALLDSVVPGWRRLDDGHYATRGTSAAGWPCVWYRAAFEGDISGQRQAVNAMAMVLPAGRDRLHLVWGMGSIAASIAGHLVTLRRRACSSSQPCTTLLAGPLVQPRPWSGGLTHSAAPQPDRV